MPTYEIRGIRVEFPFHAYDCQLVYMEKVIQSLQSMCNSLLESPTGTGKTLCLLCATLAWRKSLGDFSSGKTREVGSSQQESVSGLPTIVYASRTHSQLRQVVKELKRTNYRPKMVVLGSREQLCIHEDVKNLHGKAQTNACHYLCRRKGQRHCSHFTRVTDFMKHNPHLGDEPIDIEDLVDIGKRVGPCPYYISRELHKAVDILFAPYNYLIDKSYRKSLSINWENSVLIFDEAHNLESICADAASFDLSSGLLAACISEAKTCTDLSVVRREESSDKSRNPDDFAILKALLLKLEKKISDIPIQSKELGLTKPGLFLYELLAELNITHDTASKLINIIEDAAILLEEDKQSKATGTTCRLESIGDILQIAFGNKGNANAQYYRVHIQETEGKASDMLKGKAIRTLSWWCFNPGITMQGFSALGVGSIILTSGTLSPMDSFAQELKLNFPIRLQNPHVISSCQIWAGVVPVGPSGRALNSSYRNRDSIEYKQELGNAIVNFSRIVPDGLLVFFPSYYLLDQCVSCWKQANPTNSMTIWERICNHKKPVVEPRQSSLFPSAIEDFKLKLKDKSTNGAVFFAVCRGKVSEGLDFADRAGRAVVIIGMPFASTTEPKVRLKREYLDEQLQTLQEDQKLTGEDWYTQQASRAVNQAIGRVIRHRRDYGAIIFCDERFSHRSRLSEISLWMRPYIKCYSNFGDVVFALNRFFRDDEARNLAIFETERNGCTEINQESQVGAISEGHKFLSMPEKKDLPEESTSTWHQDIRQKIGVSKEIPPANRSHLSRTMARNGMNLSLADDPLDRQRRLASDMPTTDAQGCKSDDNVAGVEGKLLPCFLRKRKISDSYGQNITFPSNNLTDQDSEKFNLSSSSRSTQLCSQSSSDIPIMDELRDTNRVHDCKSLEPISRGPQFEETKGSMFLSQVKDKLSGEEYKEFIESMKAVRCRSSGMADALQRIAALFGGPEKLPLLERFKEFFPLFHRFAEQHK